MSSKSARSAEMRNAVVWLEKQPGIANVVQGRYTRVRHKHNPGFARIVSTDPKTVHVRVFDKLGSMEVFVYAPKSDLRDRWVALLASGDVISAEGVKTAAPRKEIRTLTGPEAANVPKPKAQVVKQDAAQLYDVTPDLACQWLERNTRNRKLYQRVVNRYAADMKAGRWQVVGDAISFDTNGAVINGQHRLWAVFESGVTVQMLVVFNLDPSAVDVLDDHLKRNLRDVATIRRPGVAVGAIHAAIANALVQSSIRSTAADVVGARERVSRQVQLDMLDRHMEAIQFVVRECLRSATVRSITVAPVLTPIVRAFYTQDRERLLQFGRVLVTGLQQDQYDAPVVKLRNLLMRGQVSRTRVSTESVYRKTERALQAFLERERIETLYEASTELFPLPEEQTVVKAKKRA